MVKKDNVPLLIVSDQVSEFDIFIRNLKFVYINKIKNSSVKLLALSNDFPVLITNKVGKI